MIIVLEVNHDQWNSIIIIIIIIIIFIIFFIVWVIIIHVPILRLLHILSAASHPFPAVSPVVIHHVATSINLSHE